MKTRLPFPPSFVIPPAANASYEVTPTRGNAAASATETFAGRFTSEERSTSVYLW